MDSKYQRLIKNSTVFMIASFGSKFFSFILVPFYTHVLNTLEYGTVDTLISTVSLFSPLATMGIGDVIAMLLSKKEYEAKKVFVNATVLIVIGNLLVTLVYPILFISDIFNEYIVYFVFLVIISSIYGVLQMYARGTDKVVACAVSGIVYTVTLALSNILFLICFKMGIEGYLLSTVIAYFVPSVYLLATAKEKCFKISLIDKKMIHKTLLLSIPLIPTSILWVLMNLADKYAILWYVGASGNGIYAVAHKIPTIIWVIYGVFQQAWQLTTFELENKEERSATYSKIFELLTCVVLSIAAILVILNRLYIVYFCEESYAMAWKVSPILMYAAILNSMSGFIDSNYLIMNNTKALLKVTGVGTIINLIMNFIIVPLWGVYGAAIATCIGYLYMVGKKYYDTTEFTPLHVNKKRFLSGNAIFILMCISVVLEKTIIFYTTNIILLFTIILIYKKEYVQITNIVIGKLKGRIIKK